MHVCMYACMYACMHVCMYLNPIFYDIRAQSHPDPVASDESLGKDETSHGSLVGSFLPFGLHIYGSNPMDSLDWAFTMYAMLPMLCIQCMYICMYAMILCMCVRMHVCMYVCMYAMLCMYDCFIQVLLSFLILAFIYFSKFSKFNFLVLNVEKCG